MNHKKRFPGGGGYQLIPLPLFQLRGGDGQGRADLIGRLVSSLEHRRFSCKAVIKPDRLSRFEICSLLRNHDLVVLDENVQVSVEVIPIRYREENAADLTWGENEAVHLEQLVGRIIERLEALARSVPVWGCVLIGGRSSRMGQPKHLLQGPDGRTWVERTIETLTPLVDGLVVSGNGALPEKLQSLTRLADIPGVLGPLTGILSAGRWQPMASWLLVACDMPNITEAGVRWLLERRHAGCWGVVPRLAGESHCEPLFAWYDMRALQLFEEQLLAGDLRIGGAASHRKIANPVIPAPMEKVWQNVNTPAELQTLLSA